MSDKLQFVAGFRHSYTVESCDKLKFVGHFLNSPAVSQDDLSPHFFAGFAEGCIALLGFTGVALYRGGQNLIQFSPDQYPGNYRKWLKFAIFDAEKMDKVEECI